jgi:hypothetical protein
MLPEHVAHVRSFHRLVTQRAGALDDRFLGRDRPLGESRVLFEIGPRGADLRDLRSRLGLDSGYLSRLIQSLASAGLVTLRSGTDDERVRRADLTPAGLFLSGGATVERARGRGCYRALVRARWETAVRFGLPGLAVQAQSHSSAPILRRLGFADVATIHTLRSR